MTTATLAELLEPCSAEDFLDESYGTSYRQVPGSPGKFSDLLSWARLNEILDGHPLDWLHAETDGPVVRNRLSLVRRGQAIAPASFFRDVPGPRGNPVRRVDPVRVAQLLRDGASLIVDGIDELHEPIGALAYRLERTLHEPVRVNLYASWTPTPSLERHWDTHDIFVLQVSGRKHWRVYAPRRRYPVGDDVDLAPAPAGEPAWEGMLEAGDLLYLPRGWWHAAAAVNGPSLHLTVGVYKRTGLDLVEWLRGQLRDSETFREDLPRFASPAEQSDHLERLRDELLARWDTALLDRFLRDADAAATPRRPTLNLPCIAPHDSQG